MSHTIEHITIAILTKDGGDILVRALDAIASQRTSLRVELLAVDSGSSDGTLDRLRDAGAQVLQIPPEDFNFGGTRDFAYDHAQGDIVVNLSQDAVPASEYWLESLIAPLNDPEVAIACGRSVPDSERDGSQFAWERNGYFYFTREMRRFARRHGRGVSFANSAVRRSVWEEFRFRPQVLGEDFQFQMNCTEAGYRVRFPDGAEVLHHHQYDVRSLCRRCRAEGAALREMGCGYSELDVALDLLNPRTLMQWARELRYGRLDGAASALFPVLRPVSVYIGSRFGAARKVVAHG